MNINFLLIESSRPQWSEMAFESYKSKFNKSITISWNGIKPATRNKNYSDSEVVQKESALLKKKIKEHDCVVALDKEGINLDTPITFLKYFLLLNIWSFIKFSKVVKPPLLSKCSTF